MTGSKIKAGHEAAPAPKVMPVLEGLMVVAKLAGIPAECLLAPYDVRVPRHVLIAAFKVGVVRCGATPAQMRDVIGLGAPEWAAVLPSFQGGGA